jgi:2-keto-3-deoxy-L-rhamnonate aldolase RhmA
MESAVTRNRVKKALLEREVTIGAWIQIGHPAISEVFANAGFDWIAADCEHTDIDLKTFTDITRGMYGRGSVPLVRVRENDTLAIRQVLDAGAQGIIVPLVNTAEDAEKAVAAAKFTPEGIRGFAFCRGNNWGMDFNEYARSANDDTSVIIMIESREAVENIDDILGVEGVDAVFIGPYDMSGSYQVTGQISHPDIQKAFITVAAACKRSQKSAGLHVVSPSKEAITRAVESGFTFIAIGMDIVFLDQGARNALQIARQIHPK